MESAIEKFLRSKFDIEEIVPNNWNFDCPFCDDTKKRCGMHMESGFWNCLNGGCDHKGKSLRSFQKALDGEVRDSDEIRESNEVKEDRKKEKKEYVEIKQDLAAKHLAKLDGAGRGVFAYLTKVRGFKPETIQHFQLGSWKTNGFEYVSIPFWKRGKLVNIKYRAIDYKDRKWKWRRIRGGESSLFHDDVVDHENTTIFLTEAELDAVALWNAGYKNVVAVTTGAKSFKQEWFERLTKFKKIYIVYDNDVDGQAGAEKVAKRLGLDRCHNIVLPKIEGLPKVDVNDYFWNQAEKKARHTASDFSKLIKAARRYEVPDVVSLRTAIKDAHRSRFLADDDEVMGFPTPWSKVNNLTKKGTRPGHLVVVSGISKVGKCVKHDTLVVDPDSGKRITIEQAIKQRLPLIYSYDEETRKVRVCEISDWYDSGIKPHLRITTKLGDSVETTLNHPFLTFDGWKEAQDVTVGDYVAVPNSIPIFGQKSLSFESCFILGSLIADGATGLSQTSPTWSKHDSVLIDLMKESLSKAFDMTLVPIDGTSYRLTNHPDFANPINRWFSDLGLRCKSKHKFIPDVVFQFDQRSLCDFLGALWSGDGSVSDQGIEYGSASERLIDDLKHLMLRLGIRMVKRKRYTTCEGKKFPSWRLMTHQTETIRSFQRSIPLFGAKRDALRQLLEGMSEDPKRDYLTTFPQKMWGVFEGEAARRGVTMSSLARLTGRPKFLMNGGCSRWMLSKINLELKSPVLQSWIDADVSFVRVRSVEATGNHQCYDLTVPETSTFIANDFVIHNTSWTQNWLRFLGLQDISTFIYECEMKPDQLSEKWVAMETPDMDQKEDFEEKDFSWATYKLPVDKIWIGHPQSEMLTLEGVCKTIKAAVQRYGCRVVVFDNLHFLVRSDNVKDEIGRVTRTFKLLAESLNIMFVLIVHPRKIGTKEPTPDDLKDSSSIFQDLDTLIFVHRFFVASNKDDDESDQKAGYGPLTKVTVQGRWSPGGVCWQYFDGQRALFYDRGDMLDQALAKFKTMKAKGKKDEARKQPSKQSGYQR